MRIERARRAPFVIATPTLKAQPQSEVSILLLMTYRMDGAGGAHVALPVYADAGHWELVHDVAANLDSATRDDYLIR